MGIPAGIGRVLIFCVNGAVGAVSTGKGDSPIFVDTRIGTAPWNLPVTPVGDSFC
jgi:hypothetical protein